MKKEKTVIELMTEYRKLTPSAKDDKPTKAPSAFKRIPGINSPISAERRFTSVAKTAETDLGRLINNLE